MKNLIFTTLLIPLLFIGCTGSSSDNAPWVSLFNGKDLTGWEQKGGVARYTIEDGAIVGTTVPASPNTFLCTKEKYGDFILEFDVKLDGPINSGVQFRSNNFKEYDHGRVHGYQCELDPSDRSWTGGIYDEARRGWLYPLNEDEKARAAYKHLEWNKIRIEAIGDSMKIWVNDIPTAHLIDDRTPSGYIALQVHSISVPEEDNKHIMWRNIRIITDNPANYATPTPLAPKNNYNRLTGSEASWEWKLLWDGQSTTGWRGAKSDTFPLSQT
ncbi:MAG: DUF1080 domain-containing protein, partial [Cyclobacteriaceae bacterium]|nr:DUF1080 domain-containing protein [Cyclobacteriaceae bacterium]